MKSALPTENYSGSGSGLSFAGNFIWCLSSNPWAIVGYTRIDAREAGISAAPSPADDTFEYHSILVDFLIEMTNKGAATVSLHIPIKKQSVYSVTNRSIQYRAKSKDKMDVGFINIDLTRSL